jgi:DNA-binding CsgD family transcriptional regulator
VLGVLLELLRSEIDIAGLDGRGDVTPAELATLRLIASGRTRREVASELGYSVNTIKSRLRSAYVKLGVNTSEELELTHHRLENLQDSHELMAASRHGVARRSGAGIQVESQPAELVEHLFEPQLVHLMMMMMKSISSCSGPCDWGSWSPSSACTWRKSPCLIPCTEASFCGR